MDVPVFGTVAEAMAATGADVSVVFVPPAHTKAAVLEAIDAGMPLTVIITEGIPVADTAEFFTARRQGRAPGRAELPRRHQPREVQRRHHPGGHHRARAGSGSCRSPGR